MNGKVPTILILQQVPLLIQYFLPYMAQVIDHFTVVCLVPWRLNVSEAGGDLALTETSLLFLC